MSETQTSTAGTQQVVVVNQKSALVGFLLALIGLGWFGVDRFYKGDTKIGLFKLFCPILAILAAFVFNSLNAFAVILAIGGFFWLLDWILVPLGISRDNARKLAEAQNVGVAVVANQSTSTQAITLNQKNKIQDVYVYMIAVMICVFVMTIGWLLHIYANNA